MRTISDNLKNAITNVRMPAARITIRDNRLIFGKQHLADGFTGSVTVGANSTTLLTAEQPFAPVDCDVLGSTIVRVAAFKDNFTGKWYLCVGQSCYTDSAQTINYTSTGIELVAFSIPGIICNATKAYIFYQPVTDEPHGVYRAELSSTLQVQNTTLVYKPDGYISMPITAAMPVSVSECYLNVRNLSGTYSDIILVGTNGVDPVELYPNCTTIASIFPELENDGNVVNQIGFDAVRLVNGTDRIDYIFFPEKKNKRTMYVRVVNNVPGEIRPFIPIDITDDESFFKLGGVNVINGRVIVTGVISRAYGGSMHIYSFGLSASDVHAAQADHWTMGRDLYIVGSQTPDYVVQAPGGKLMLGTVNGKTVALYANAACVWQADATSLLGVSTGDRTLTTSKFAALDMASASNQSTDLTIEFGSAHLGHELFRPGNSIEIELGYGGYYCTIGRFEIDSVVRQYIDDGVIHNLVASGYASKRLAQWKPDSVLEYQSQIKQTTAPGSYTGVVRGSGNWLDTPVADGTTGLRPESLNTDAFIFSAEMPARDVVAVARINAANIESVHRYDAGPTFAYWREDKASAAKRLGKKEDDLTDHDYGNNCIAAYFTNNNFDGTPANIISIRQLVNNVWHPGLGGFSFVPGGGPFYLMVRFQNGKTRLFVRQSSQTAWTQFATDDITIPSDAFPWPRQSYSGRGGAYVRTSSGYLEHLGFLSNSMLIPVKSYAGVSIVDGTVITVSDEIIELSGKSNNSDYYTNLRRIWVVNEQGRKSNYGNHVTWGQIEDNAPQFYVTPLISHSQQTIRKLMTGFEISQTSGENVMLSRMNGAKLWLYATSGGLNTTCNVMLQRGVWDEDIHDYVYETLTYLYSEPGVDATKTEATSIRTGLDYEWVALYPNRDVYLLRGAIYAITLVGDATSNSGAPSFGFGDRQLSGLNDYTPPMNGMRLFHNQAADQTEYTIQVGQDLYFKIEGYVATGMDFGVNKFAFSGLPDPATQITGSYEYEAILVTDGPGKGYLSVITEFDKAQSTAQYTVLKLADSLMYVSDQDTSRFALVPLLHIRQRGKDNTPITTHAPGYLHINTGGTAPCIERLDYFSCDLDLRMQDMIAEIAGRAGVKATFEAARVRNSDLSYGVMPTLLTLTGAGSSFYQSVVEKDNHIVRLRVNSLPNGRGVGICARRDSLGANYILLRVMKDGAGKQTLEYVRHFTATGQNGIRDVVREAIPLDIPVEKQWLTFSIQGNILSAWVNGLHVGSFVCNTESVWSDGTNSYAITPDTVLTGVGTVYSFGQVTIEIDWSELDDRVENFILDMGTGGQQLLDDLIKDRRILYQDAPDGSLRFFRNRPLIADMVAAPYRLHFGHSITTSDSGVATRIMADGMDTVELQDADLLSEYGNLYAYLSIDRLDSRAAIKAEIEKIFRDMKAQKTVYSLSGAFDPRLEVNDIVPVQLDSQTVKWIVVESIRLMVTTHETEASIDMELNGHEYL